MNKFQEKVIEYMKKNSIPLLPDNVILHREDNVCQMSEVIVNGQEIMTSNHWDFNPTYYGLDLPDFSHPNELVELFQDAIKSAGKEVNIVIDDTWRYACFLQH